MKFRLMLVFFLAVHFRAPAQDSSDVQDAASVAHDDGFHSDASDTLGAWPPPAGTAPAYLEEKIEVKQFDEEQWKRIVGTANYQETPRKNWGFEFLSHPWAGLALKVIAYAIVLGIVVSVFYLLMKHLSFERRIKRSSPIGAVEEGVENIEDVDIEALLERARREGNLKLAVRLYYLNLLRKLNARGMIAWKKDKTNSDYLSELYARNFYFPEMRRLTFLYERIWYGDHSLDAAAFNRLSAEFESVFSKIEPPQVS